MEGLIKKLIHEAEELIKTIPETKKSNHKVKHFREWRRKIWIFGRKCHNFTTSHIISSLIDDLDELKFRPESIQDFKKTETILRQVIKYFSKIGNYYKK